MFCIDLHFWVKKAPWARLVQVKPSRSAGNVVLYEFLAWLQEQEQFWEVEERVEEQIEPALPQQPTEHLELDERQPREAEPSGRELAQVRATGQSTALDVGFLSSRTSFRLKLSPADQAEWQ